MADQLDRIRPCDTRARGLALRAEAAARQLWFASSEIDETDIHVNAAKYLANEAAMLNSDWNIQLHGGIGITQEFPAHRL